MKYVLYFRVSTKGQGESGLGLEAQKSYLSHYIPEKDVAATFTEVKSAKSMDDREQLQKAVALCKAKGYGLAVAKVDRLSRNTEDALTLLPQLDGFLFCADLPMRAGDRVDKFMLTLFLAIADRERELISLRTKAGMAVLKAKHGTVHHVKGTRSNWSEDAREKSLASRRENTDSTYKSVLAHIESARAREESFASIASQLNLLGKRTVRGGKFHANTVKRIAERG